MRTNRLLASLLVAAPATLLATQACSSDGELVIIVRSEIPIDGVAYEVLRDGALVERRCVLITETSAGGLPGSISVVGPADAPVTIRLLGLVGSTCDTSGGFDAAALGDLAVLREIVTTIPDGRSASLPVIFTSSCQREDGVIVADGVGEFDDSACSAGTTCIDDPSGACESSEVDSSELDDYEEGDVGSGGAGQGPASSSSSSSSSVTSSSSGIVTVDCAVDDDFLADAVHLGAIQGGPDALFYATMSGAVTRVAGSGSTEVVTLGLLPDTPEFIAAHAEPQGQVEHLAIGTKEAAEQAPVRHVRRTGPNAYVAEAEGGADVQWVAVAYLDDAVPLWVEAPDPVATPAHRLLGGVVGPLSSTTGIGRAIAAAGPFAAYLRQDAGDFALEVIDLTQCTTNCAPLFAEDVVMPNAISVGGTSAFGPRIAWTDGSNLRYLEPATSLTVLEGGTDHPFVALNLFGQSARFNTTGLLEIFADGPTGTPVCDAQLVPPSQGDEPKQLVLTTEGMQAPQGVAYLRWESGAVYRVSIP